MWHENIYGILSEILYKQYYNLSNIVVLERLQSKKTANIARETWNAGPAEQEVDAVHGDDEDMCEKPGAEQL